MPTPTALNSGAASKIAAGNAGAVQHQAQRQPADAGADDQNSSDDRPLTFALI